MNILRNSRAIVLQKSAVQKKPAYNDAVLVERQISELKPGEVLVKVRAAAFNHRDLWIRKGQFSGIAFGSVLGADGAGTIVSSAATNDPLLNKRVFLTPCRGWEKDPLAPESHFGILGGVRFPSIGTFAEYVVVERDQVIPTPEHLDDVQAAAWPLAGVTAWRVTMVNGEVQKGQNVLISGIGGGVALTAMQLCITKGAAVYVTSSSREKIQKAVTMGAKDGVNYKESDWSAQLGSILMKNTTNSELDVVIDSGGGDIMGRIGRYLKQGGRVVCYGMTASQKITFTMREVLRNQKLLCSTMGSHQDLINATQFLAQHRIVPVVSHVLDGLESSEEGFELLKHGDHFGKVVIKIRDGTRHSKL